MILPWHPHGTPLDAATRFTRLGLPSLNTRMPIPSFKAYLTELADHPYAVRKIVRTYDEIVSTFTTDAGDRYNISFERGEKYDDWQMEFSLEQPGATTSDILKARNIKLGHEAMYGVTGAGDALRVLATVVLVLRQFIAAQKPTQISFSAHEPSRIKLYQTFVRQVHRYLPAGWTGTDIPNGHERKFTLTGPA